MFLKSGRCRHGISVLEIVFTVAILVLIGSVVILLIGRGQDRRQGSLRRLPETPFEENAPDRDLRSVSGDTAAPDSSTDDGFAVGAGVAESGWGWRGGGSEPVPGAGAAERSVQRKATVPGDDLRAYFGGALAVAGRPDWQTFISLARKLDLSQLPAAWSLLQEQPWSRDKQEAMKVFVAHWATQDPQAAIDFASTLASARQRHSVYGTAVETWALTDPEGAMAWYEQQYQATGRGPDRHFFAGLYAASPDSALALVWQMEDARRQSSVLRSLFLPHDADREQGAHQLKALFDASEDPDQRMLLADMVAGVWASSDPMRAIAWGAELQDDPGVQERIYMAAAQAWGRREPEAAMAWLEEQNLAQVEPRVLHNITRSWGRDNPTSLQQWIDSSAPSPVRDTVVTAHIDSLRSRDPAAALALAESITVSGGRYKVMASVADRWLQVNRNAAAAAVLASSMPTEMKRKYAMKVIPRNQKKR